MPDYEIGYGKPPERSRFRKGISGNPTGRPKGTKNFKTDLAEELGERIVIREGERSRKISKQRAIIKTLFAQTLKGDVRAANTLMTVHSRFFAHEGEAAIAGQPLGAEEREVLESLRVRLLGDSTSNPVSSGETSDATEGES